MTSESNKVIVFHSYPKWGLSGVNTWTVNMFMASTGSEFDHRVLFTGIPPQPEPELDALGIPYDFLNIPAKRSRRDEWQELKCFLEDAAPCIYVPNYDFHRSCAIGTLSLEVKVCLVIHSDEDCYFDEIRRLGGDCDAIVCVSSYLTNKVRVDFPELVNVVTHIPYGIPLPDHLPEEVGKSSPLRLAYCNRLQQYQKRVFDLPEICRLLREGQVEFQLTIAGDGPDRPELEKRLTDAGVSDQVDCLGRVSNAEVMEILRESDVFLLTSDFEGLPISLLEAMSMGAVPVVYRIESGINDAIENGSNGLQITHGDVGEFAAALADLAADRDRLNVLSGNARRTASTKFSLERMCADYGTLFDTLTSKDQSSSKPKRSGKISPPKDLRLPARAGKWIRRILN